jgi:GWxTD domain-containing protein
LQDLINGKLDKAFRQQREQIAQAEVALEKARAAYGNRSFEEIQKQLQQAEKELDQFNQGVMIGVARASKNWGQANEGLLAHAQPESARLQAPAEPESAYQKWLNEDVAYIVSAEERNAFVALSTDAERDQFIEQFWLRRDPTPGTAENEFKEEHYRRIAYANEHYASSVPGWQTDRGRIYIMYGPPDEISVSMRENVLRQMWRYTHIDGLGYDIETEFTDTSKTDDFHMTAAPTSHGSYWQVMTGTPERAQTVVESLRARGFPALAARLSFWGGGATRVGSEAASTSKSVMLETRSVLVGPYPDEASLAKAKAALEVEGFRPVPAQ